MTKEKDMVLELIHIQNKLVSKFNCEKDFFFKPLVDLEWTVRQDDDFYFLCYWSATGEKIEAVIVKKNGEAVIYKTNKYTMVVAIDCVRIGFIFHNEKMIKK